MTGAGGALPSRLHRDEAVVALPVAHITGFTALLGLAAAGVPVHYFPRFRAERGARRDRAAPRHHVHRRAGDVPADGRGGRIRPRPEERAGVGVGRRRDARGPGRSASGRWARARRSRSSGHVGEALFVEGYGMVELGGGVALKVGLEPRRRSPATASGSSTTTVARSALGQVGELWVQGPGTLPRLLRRREGDGRRADARRLGAHRRPRPARASATPCSSRAGRRT